jgi:cell fate (sporulation/competence/biofilm development) regulator YlbF (YheA/YmcA/DUF963 family)
LDANRTISEVLKYLRQTPEFSELKQARESLSKTPHANTLVSQFQKKQESLYSGTLSQSQTNYLLEELHNDHEKLNINPEIKAYFAASERFSALLNQFVGRLNSELAKEFAAM